MGWLDDYDREMRAFRKAHPDAAAAMDERCECADCEADRWRARLMWRAYLAANRADSTPKKEGGA